MRKHTPGEWRVGRGAGGEPFSIESSTRTIALVKTCRDETEANAHLIAASPKLFEAAKMLLEARDSGNILEMDLAWPLLKQAIEHASIKRKGNQ